MVLFTFRPGVTYTVFHEFNGPGTPSVRRNLNHREAKAHAAFLMGLWPSGAMRPDSITIEGSDGSQRHIYP